MRCLQQILIAAVPFNNRENIRTARCSFIGPANNGSIGKGVYVRSTEENTLTRVTWRWHEGWHLRLSLRVGAVGARSTRAPSL